MVDHLVAGGIAGLIGGLLFAALALVLTPEQPLKSQVLASKFGSRPPGTYRGWGIALHLIYFAGMGTLFAFALEELLDPVASYGAWELAWMGLAFGLVLWVLSWFWTVVLRLRAERRALVGADRARLFVAGLLGYALYGVVLGGAAARLLATMPAGWFH